jgi:hypothetical protein
VQAESSDDDSSDEDSSGEEDSSEEEEKPAAKKEAAKPAKAAVKVGWQPARLSCGQARMHFMGIV